MDKLRDEFEFAWQVSRADDEGNLGHKPTRSRIDSDNYAGDAAQFAWVWWRRSRAAQCIDVGKAYMHGGLLDAHIVKQLLDEAGIPCE